MGNVSKYQPIWRMDNGPVHGNHTYLVRAVLRLRLIDTLAFPRS